MSRPLTVEQGLLSRADKLLLDYSSDYGQRLLVLEACAAKIGGIDIIEYWSEFQIEVPNASLVKKTAEGLVYLLSSVGVPVSLALSSLAREPVLLSEQKKNGAFYTDFRLANFIAEDCFAYINRDSTIADIASGSGILLAAVAEKYYSLFPKDYNKWISECVYAYDLSSNALRGARIALMTHASSVEAVKRMYYNWKACDTLLAEDTYFLQFDIVVGNPPWGKVKLSRHTFLNSMCNNSHIYGSQCTDFDKDQFLSEKKASQEYSKYLKNRYTLLGAAEPDLYMAFLQKAISVLAPGGHLSYLVPAGLIRSLGTEALRRFLLISSRELKYYLFDNRARFFEIDSRFKFIVISQNKIRSEDRECNSLLFEICNGNETGIKRGKEIRFQIAELESIRPDLTIPECRSNEEKDLFHKIYSNGTSWKDEWLVDVAREVDMTNNRQDFHGKTASPDIPVIEGRMVQQFRFGAKAYVDGSGRSAKWVPNDGSIKAQFYIHRDSLNDRIQKRIDIPRVGYCDIAGQTNERAMMSAIIPAGVVCGNKVPTIVFPTMNGCSQMYFFVGVTNSFVFDWLLRRVLSTTVNYFVLFGLPMPKINFDSELAKKIIMITKELSLLNGDYYTSEKMELLRAELDVLVGKSFGLNFHELELIMEDFPSLDRYQPAINGEQRSTITRDTFLSAAEFEYGICNRIYDKRVKLGKEQNARAYIPSEMVGLSRGGATCKDN